MPIKRIEICGGIASGKTTLAQLLEKTTLTTTYEDFKSVPFWRAFYTDPMRFGFETELGFLIQHYHEVKLKDDQVGLLVCDFSFIQDRAYAELNLEGSAKHAFMSVYDEVLRQLGTPELVIHLRCSEHEEYDRVKKRARLEEASMELAYLADLNSAIAKFVASVRYAKLYLEIDSEAYNFAENIKHQGLVVRTVRTALRDDY